MGFLKKDEPAEPRLDGVAEENAGNISKSILAKLSSLAQALYGRLEQRLDGFISQISEQLRLVEKRIVAVEDRVAKVEAVTSDVQLQEKTALELSHGIRDLYSRFKSHSKMLPLTLRDLPEVKAFLAEHGEDIRKLERKANFDKLTGVYSRNFLEDFLVNETDYVVGFTADIDHFKKVNDTYGHDRGDEVLRNVARTIYETLGQRGTIFRVGGEEFLGLIRLRNPQKALPLETVSHIKGILEAIRIQVMQKCGCTISIGVAEGAVKLPLNEVSRNSLFDVFGDKQVYAAKAAGRNRVVLLQDELVKSLNKIAGIGDGQDADAYDGPNRRRGQ